VGLAGLGIDAEGPIESFESLVKAAELPQRAATIIEGPEVVRSKGKGRIIACERVFEAAKLLQEVSAVEMKFWIARHQGDGPIVA
jgi:hypothetical protein